MQMYYSESTRGFYIDEVHGDGVPEDAVKITPEEHSALLEGQGAGKDFKVIDGKVELVDYDPLPLDEEKEERITALNKAYNKAVASLDGEYPLREAGTFDKQAAEASTFLKSGDESDAPLLASIASARGIELKDLATKVSEKSTSYLKSLGELTGKRQVLVQAVNDATTNEEVLAVVWEDV